MEDQWHDDLRRGEVGRLPANRPDFRPHRVQFRRGGLELGDRRKGALGRGTGRLAQSRFNIFQVPVAQRDQAVPNSRNFDIKRAVFVHQRAHRRGRAWAHGSSDEGVWFVAHRFSAAAEVLKERLRLLVHQLAKHGGARPSLTAS
jgi:hypothetical protein